MDHIAEMKITLGYTGAHPWIPARTRAPGSFGILQREDFVFNSRDDALDYIHSCHRRWRKDLYGKPPKFRIRAKAEGGRCDYCGDLR